ncbi:uncharacterized protein BJ171DRAFT_28930 [Polychytrium aggregatum]|uniref:uncharacterized protein n=1 Tax=Polychytrium aggregatum TaxID=110093 RepID=UPI0022FDB72B|nr:uncharacterized protein BJ171DRAFT_28930 [Polychytrium aggregatum]KAI9206355.1 hypothetical protein BJ171DRAFT_28930 [Polychytrium aggregatum]
MNTPGILPHREPMSGWPYCNGLVDRARIVMGLLFPLEMLCPFTLGSLCGRIAGQYTHGQVSCPRASSSATGQVCLLPPPYESRFIALVGALTCLGPSRGLTQDASLEAPPSFQLDMEGHGSEQQRPHPIRQHPGRQAQVEQSRPTNQCSCVVYSLRCPGIPPCGLDGACLLCYSWVTGPHQGGWTRFVRMVSRPKGLALRRNAKKNTMNRKMGSSVG